MFLNNFDLLDTHSLWVAYFVGSKASSIRERETESAPKTIHWLRKTMWPLTKQHLALRIVTRRHIEDKLCEGTIPTTSMIRFRDYPALN